MVTMTMTMMTMMLTMLELSPPGHPLDQLHHSPSRHQGGLPAGGVDVQTVELGGRLLELLLGHLTGGLQQLHQGRVMAEAELLPGQFPGGDPDTAVQETQLRTTSDHTEVPGEGVV